MPAYNAGRYIAKAIESVLAQDYRNFELIVVDDGSTDSTRDIVEGFKDDRIRYFRRENTKGAASARNLAIRKSKGVFLFNLDADDMIVPDFINKHLREFEKHPDADLIYCDDLIIDEEDKPIRVIKRPEYTNRKLLIRELFRCGFPIVPFRTCIRKSVFDKIGLFDEDLPVAEDYDMMRRLVKNGLKMYHFNGALYLRRMTEDSLSRTFTAEKAKAHFAVIKRYADTFDYDELFPDVDWEKIEPEKRGLNAKYLVAETISALGQSYSSNAPVYTQVASELALSILDDCLKAGPDNILFRNLMEKSRLVRRNRNRALLNTLPARG
jgi:glycosyltransferase involved in cell wall biosynthesis